MSEFDLEKLSFGAPAAERDINQGLVHYFVESDTFAQLQARKKTLVLGNRGAGKSALFKVLAQRERDKHSLVLELAPENYSYEILTQHMVPESKGSWAKQGAYAAAWKYLIYVLVMKELTHAGPSFKSGSAGKIYKFLRDNFKGEQPSPIAVLVSYLKRMESIKIGSYEAALKTKQLTSLYRLEEVTELFPAVDDLCERRKVVILVDELDRGWDASEDAKAFVGGLVQAALSINDRHRNLTVFVSLRKDYTTAFRHCMRTRKSTAM
jgi:energy-coupling factor transporter ATP-binding protein EcfA2